MTGLDPTTDTILSLSCFITTAQLDLVEPTGYHCTIQHTAEQLARMSAWCIEHHGASGLSAQCLSSPPSISATTAARELLAYIQLHIPPLPAAAAAAAGGNTSSTGTGTEALLAGNSVHADRMFLRVPPWNAVLDRLHYRIFDVSACKEMVRRWCPDSVLQAVPQKRNLHTAREDILESIQEARFYRRLFMQMALPPPPSPPSPPSPPVAAASASASATTAGGIGEGA